MAETYLLLEDGTVLPGRPFGYGGDTEGEVVFSTGMAGYPESLTDPSFAGQILVFTYPLLGNYGVPAAESMGPHLMRTFESERLWVRGVVVSTEGAASHYRSAREFSDWLASQQIPGIAHVDTRALTLKLREKGVMRGAITRNPKVRPIAPDSTHFVSVSSLASRQTYTPERPNGKHVALIDCGVKHGIIRALLARGYKVTRIPWNEDPLAVSGIDGVVCSNGPGDPKDCGKTIGHIRRVTEKGVPFLGVCLGHQLLALAIGADTYKLRYGHRGLNQPCQDVTTGKAYVTSQNHGYAVNRDTIPAGFSEWFINLNDRTNEGIRHDTKPFRSVQFHPEGHPGPFDTDWIFSLI